MPGKVISGHAKVEDDCRACHIPFRKDAQDRQCTECHKEVGADVAARRGFHGRQKTAPCRTCHTDHKGRDAKIVTFDERRFDHVQTDFALRGAHPKVECRKCHVPEKKYREAPETCVACHAKDDKHKGALGKACADCHTESDWKETRFDHAKTRFSLTGKHSDVKCTECHRNNVYKDTPSTCVGCHRKEDKHQGRFADNAGRFGDRCETCHGTADWKKVTFDHDSDTRYPLRGLHRRVNKCESCHLPQQRAQTSCISCHRKDDKHQGTLGNACADCHVERGWKETRFDHAKTRFPLLGKHENAECNACHKTQVFNDVPGTCIGCHRKDDTHKGSLGEKCADCHDERNWKKSKFDHQRTRFPLTGKHVGARCESCHKDQNYRRTPGTCVECHQKEDKHEGQQGRACEQCHGTGDWKRTTFDHAKTKFPLLGRHALAKCESCHSTLRFKDVKSLECGGCHEKDDTHKGRLGPRCEQCHNVRDWRIWDFNHGTRTKFVLDGAHSRISCHACHRAAVKDKPTLPTSCISCHQTDDRHDGSFGRQCEKCHVTANWRQILRQRTQHGRGSSTWSWLWPDGNLHRIPAREAHAS